VIICKSIAILEKVGHICQIHDGQLLCKALLAAKLQQEHVSNNEDYAWRFCINYIPLNQVMRQIGYPIPCCDSALTVEFGVALYFWLFDATMGYHHLSVSPNSQEILAFQGTGAIKWTYTVMLFVPANGPATFI
jgi:hypothetical protein